MLFSDPRANWTSCFGILCSLAHGLDIVCHGVF